MQHETELTDELAAARFRAMCELHDFGVYVTLQRLREEHPDASPGEIARLVSRSFGHDLDAWEGVAGFRARRPASDAP